MRGEHGAKDSLFHTSDGKPNLLVFEVGDGFDRAILQHQQAIKRRGDQRSGADQGQAFMDLKV